MANLARLFLRRDVAATWQSANPTLGAGEPGFESDQFRLRIGNGALAFNALRAFLSVPTGAITRAQALLNATTQADQRAAIGITTDISALNSIGGDAALLTDFDDMHTLGSGFYSGTSATANNPDGTSITGSYVRFNSVSGQFIGFGSVGGVNPPRMWVRNYSGGWGQWQSWAGYAQASTDLNTAVVPGAFRASATTLNTPEASSNFHVFVISPGPTEVLQIAFKRAGPETYARRYADGAWGAWTEGITTANLLAKMKAIFATLPYQSTEQTITSGGLLTLAHGLGAEPSFVTLKIICKVADNGYAVGDTLDLFDMHLNPSAIYCNATNVYVRFATGAAVRIANKTTGASVNATLSSWKIVVRAYP